MCLCVYKRSKMACRKSVVKVSRIGEETQVVKLGKEQVRKLKTCCLQTRNKRNAQEEASNVEEEKEEYLVAQYGAEKEGSHESIIASSLYFD